MLVEVMSSPRRGTRSKAKKKKKMTQSQISVGTNKLTVTFPQAKSSGESSESPVRLMSRRNTPRSRSSPNVIDSVSDEGSAPVIHSSRKRKHVEDKTPSPPPIQPKKKQKIDSSKNENSSKKAGKNSHARGSVKAKSDVSDETDVTDTEKNGSGSPCTLEAFLKDTDLKKWRYLVDVISDEDIEAIQICINE